MDTFTAIASLFGIAALLSFVNDRYLRLQHDIGLLLLAGLTTASLRVLEIFVPTGAIGQLHQLTQSFNLNDTLLKGYSAFCCFGVADGSFGRRFGSSVGWCFGWLSLARRRDACSQADWPLVACQSSA